MKKTSIEDRIRIEQFTDEFIPEGVIEAPGEIRDVITFFQKEKTSATQYIYVVPIPSLDDIAFAECYNVEIPFQYINRGDYIVSLLGNYSCVMKKEELINCLDPKFMLQKPNEQPSNDFKDE